MRRFRLVAALLLAGLLSQWAIAEPANDSAATVTLDTLRTVEHQVEQVVAKVMPCTVCVRSATRRGAGSGVIVDADGLVLTAAHVTRAAGNDLVVIFPDGREVKAKALGANRTRDTALVQILDKGKYPFAEMGHSNDLKPNKWCIALGHAGGFDPRRTPPVRLGRVINNGPFITTDCTLIGGDSGGPLFDLQGRVIGIHSNIGAALWQNNHVPIDAFRDNWDRMRAGETWGRMPGRGMDPNRPMLGVQFDPNENPDGCLVHSVIPGSPAAKAGVKADDIVQQIDDRPVKSLPQAVQYLGTKKAGTEVVLKIKRGSESIETRVKLVRARELEQLMRASPQNGKDDGPMQKGSPNTKAPAEQTPQKKSKQRKSRSGAPDADADKSASSENKDEQPKEKAGDKTGRQPDGKPPLDMRELMRRARRNGGRLRLTPDEARQFQQEMARRRRAMNRQRPSPPDDGQWVAKVFAAYRPAIEAVRKSVLPVLVDGKRVALATVVSADGLLVTKASVIDGEQVQIGMGKGKRVTGTVKRIVADYDLALIQVAADGLQPIDLAAKSTTQLGRFVVAAGPQPDPEAIGVISVAPRGLDAKKQGYLGVQTTLAEGGVRLMLVQPDTPAAAAGLQKDDIVVAIDGHAVKSTAQFARLISQHEPGSTAELKVRRDAREVTVKATLADRSQLALMPGQQQMMNQLGSRLSKKRSGFKLALQHDCPIDPEDCGGPLVDLDGHLVGVNIARAGRIKSYAIPADILRQQINRH